MKLTMGGAALSVKDVTFAYNGGAPLLRDVTFDAPAGGIFVILGPNGSGKTTLLRLVAGLATPPVGTVRLSDGTSARDASREGRIGYVPQQLGLVRNSTALENALAGALRRTPPVQAFLGLFSSADEDEALAALDAVGLREKADVKAHRLSGGERQRVAIARTLVQRPAIIVADEIIASLDIVQAHGILELSRELNRRGITTVMSLHQVDVALAHADAIAFISNGRLVGPRAPAGMTLEEARCALAG